MLDQLLDKTKTVICKGFFDEQVLEDLDVNQERYEEFDNAVHASIHYFLQKGFNTFIFTETGWFDYFVASTMSELKQKKSLEIFIITILPAPYHNYNDKPHPMEYSDRYIFRNEKSTPENDKILTEELVNGMGALLFYNINGQPEPLFQKIAETRHLPILDLFTVWKTFKSKSPIKVVPIESISYLTITLKH